MRPPCGTGPTVLLKIFLPAVAIAAVLAAPPPQKREDEEEQTQTLRLPPELPAAAAGETRKLTFHITPLSAKGLLSQQVKDALKQLRKQTGGNQVIHIRALVAGTGDLRRVRDLVSETFSADRRPLPAVTVVRAGALTLTGAQVQMEAVAVGRRDVNPNGLAFLFPPPATSGDPRAPLGPLADTSVKSLQAAFEAAGAQFSDALRVTCYSSSLDSELRSRVATAFPKAAQDFVQTVRSPSNGFVECEAVARVRAPAPRLRVVKTANGGAESPVGAVIASRLAVFTGAQMSFGFDESDGRTAIARARASVERAGATWNDVALARFYPASAGLAARVLRLRSEFFGQSPPPGTTLVWEGLPSLDAGFGLELIAAKD